jgi:hypothetical protein
MGISFETSIKKIRDDGNLKMVTFQVSRSHHPLELVFSETNSNVIEREDWQEGDQVAKSNESLNNYIMNRPLLLRMTFACVHF